MTDQLKLELPKQTPLWLKLIKAAVSVVLIFPLFPIRAAFIAYKFDRWVWKDIIELQ